MACFPPRNVGKPHRAEFTPESLCVMILQSVQAMCRAMHEDRPYKHMITVRFVKRDDGGLRAFCDAVPGFYLSGLDPRAVLRDVVPAIETLMRRNVDLDVEVVPLKYARFELRERTPAKPTPETIPEEIEYVLEPRRAA